MKTILKDIQVVNPQLPVKNGTEKELLLLQEELKAVKENASRFTSVVAHDLQAPLRMITGFLNCCLAVTASNWMKRPDSISVSLYRELTK
ncbi:MAG: hypothetical protein IPG86_12715 [Chitinophagaceae bacterium]|nr:hypothetical protein [Chitinophagaceae bacterium]